MDIEPKPACGHEKLVRLAIEWEYRLDMIQRDPRTISPEDLASVFTQLVAEIRQLKEAL